MLRHLYSCALRLHPCRFRQRFADEMLAIFDQQRGTQAALGLVLDSVCSLLRQWILRPQFLTELPTTSLRQAVPDGIPSLISLDSFRPRASAVVHGMVLSLALFCTTAFAIRYSWIHVLHVQIRAVSFDPKLQIHPNMSPDDLRGTSGAPPRYP